MGTGSTKIGEIITNLKHQQPNPHDTPLFECIPGLMRACFVLEPASLMFFDLFHSPLFPITCTNRQGQEQISTAITSGIPNRQGHHKHLDSSGGQTHHLNHHLQEHAPTVTR